MKVQCAIFYGLIQMIDMVGVFLQGAQDLHSDRIFLKILIIQIVLN